MPRALSPVPLSKPKTILPYNARDFLRQGERTNDCALVMRRPSRQRDAARHSSASCHTQVELNLLAFPLTSAPTASCASALLLALRLASFLARFRFVLESSSSSLPLKKKKRTAGIKQRKQSYVA